MKSVYSNRNNICNSYYEGSLIDGNYINNILPDIKSYLLDLPEQQRNKQELEKLLSDTKFKANNYLLVDLISLEKVKVQDLKDWKIGEAIAHVFLENSLKVKFYWNERRDTKNPYANQTGADLVGFIEMNSHILFLFGEVKTSSENAYPPQVMINSSSSMSEQLLALYKYQEKRFFLIQYLSNKVNNFPDTHPFKSDFNNAFRNYYDATLGQNYFLIGVLIRYNVEVREEDLKSAFEKIISEIHNIDITLLAIYLEIPIDDLKNLITNV